MKRRSAAVLFFALLVCSTLIAQPASELTAQQVTSRWRSAVKARSGSRVAVLTTVSEEDGIPGNVQEWFSGDDYRAEVKREFDDSQAVLAKGLSERRDWNGWIRQVEGFELQRLRTAIFETSVVVFGPPETMSSAELSKAEDGNYLLRFSAPGGLPTTWTIDRKTFLPLKASHEGEDSEITTTYSDFKAADGVLTPFHGEVAETDKPTYTWTRKTVELKSSLPKDTFAALQPGPADVHLDANAPPIHFTMESNHIVFPLSVNGRPPIGFLLDTGADQNAINTKYLADFGLKPYARTTTTGGGNSTEYSYDAGATFTLPGVELKNQHVSDLDQTGLECALGVKLGGLLGYDFISRFVIEIDYEKQLVTLHDPKTWKYSGTGFIVPVTFDNGIPFAHGSISVPTKSEIPAFFVVDFGAADTATLTSPYVKANDLTRLAQTNASVNKLPGMENQFFAQANVRGRLQQLKIGNLAVQNLPVSLSVNTKGAYASKNFSGTVGQTIYSRYHVFLDYAHQRVILEPTPEASKPIPDRQTFGLTILASGADLHQFTVASVRPASPAEKQGFKKGDVVAGIDGKPAAQFTLHELRDWLSHAGQHHELEIDRGGTKSQIPVDVELISIEKN